MFQLLLEWLSRGCDEREVEKERCATVGALAAEKLLKVVGDVVVAVVVVLSVFVEEKTHYRIEAVAVVVVVVEVGMLAMWLAKWETQLVVAAASLPNAAQGEVAATATL